MKRFISLIVIFLVCLGISSADSTEVTITFDGVKMELEEPIYIINGRTMVPVRYLFEPLGLEVRWDAENFIASGHKDGLDIIMPIGSDQARVNGEVIVLDVPATIIHSRTYVPIRFVAESTGADVGWDEDTFTVSLMSIPNYDHLSNKTILSLINQDTYDEDGPDMERIKIQYDTIKKNTIKDREIYLNAKESMKSDFVELGQSLDLIFDEKDELSDMLLNFHIYRNAYVETKTYQMKSEHAALDLAGGDIYYGNLLDNQINGFGLYEFANGASILGTFSDAKRHGYILENHADNYNYVLYNHDKANGLQMSFSKFDKYDLYLLSYYDSDQQVALEYALYMEEDKIHYEKLSNYEDGQIKGLVYYILNDGYESFYLTDSGYRQITISPSGRTYIYPTDDKGDTLKAFDGMGYLEDENLIYIGEFEDGSRAGGMYFGQDDHIFKENLMDNLADEIIEEIIKENYSDEEKIKAIHDYIAHHTQYDESMDDMSNYSYYSHTAYGALINGIAVCDGYAEALKYLLDKTDVNNVLIFGEADDDGNFTGDVNHAWNLIEVDGSYYHYDLTWNDSNQGITYNYYKQDSQYFADTHTWAIEEYQSYLD